MPIIEKIEAFIVDLPTIRPHQLSMTTMKNQSMVIIRLFCSDGIEGLGESTTIGGLSYGIESPEGIHLTINHYLAPLVIGEDATQPKKVMAKLHKNIKGNNFAKLAIEMALLDAQGKRLQVPLSTLLGGSVQNSLPVLWTLASGDTEKDIQEALHLLETKRHNTFKLKVGKRPLNIDIKHISAIKEAVGEEVKITVDVNQAWEEQEAKTAIAQLEKIGVNLIEQPISKDNVDGLARLTQRFDIPIMADEAIEDNASAIRLIKANAGSVFALKLAKAGGLYAIQEQAAMATAAGIGLYGGTMLEGTIGTVAAAHVFSTFEHLSWGTELFGPLLLTDDIVKKGIDYQNSALTLPAGVGLGLELDMNQVEKYKRKN